MQPQAASAPEPAPAPATRAPVDIETIEAAKENIVPLHSGRSATQLASVFAPSATRSGLGVKLDAEHARFQTQIAAVAEYERTGDGDEVIAHLAEDPLDISHQYVRFIIANYPAGASAANKLVPVLEDTTRRFLADARYTNDPRYFRLWAHYAKNMESPEECYRFLFAKGIAEKLAALYEEYAKVLESVGKRKQADQVYLLGINRKATPLDRLKRSHLDFQARMLVAPPLPSPPRAAAAVAASSSSSRTAAVRPILSSSSTTTTGPTRGASTSGTGVGPKGNGSMFAVFKDDAAARGAQAAAAAAGQEAEWDDFGTVKSRKRENDLEKKEWTGETMPQAAPAATATATAALPSSFGGGGGFKLEVYRDETATSMPTSHSLVESDVFARSNRAPSEAEQLRVNPFKNYSAADVDLVLRDPLENLEILAPPPPAKTKKSTSSSTTTTTTTGEKRKVKSSSSSSSSSSKSKPAAASTTDPAQPRPQQIAFKLDRLKDGDAGWISFEEERVKRRRDKYVVEADSWNGWEWKSAWDDEVEKTHRTTYTIDAETGWPVLYDSNGAPLYDFLKPPPTAPVVVEAPLSPPRRVAEPCSPRSTVPADDDDAADDEPSSRMYAPVDPNRPPSPTINTKAANAFLDGLFAKTLDFTRFNHPKPDAPTNDDDDDDDDESDDDDEFQGGLEFGEASQFSTQQATQASEVSTDDGGFVPFSQTRSMMGDDSSFFGASSQDPHGGGGGGSAYGPGLFALSNENDDDDNDENATPPAAPIQLFRDVDPSDAGGGGFRPVKKRAPLGAKPIASQPPVPEPAFSVFQDSRQVVVPCSQPDDEPEVPAIEDAYEEEQEEGDYEAPLRSDSPGRPPRHDLGDGYAMGRRERGVPSRYAPFVDNMTPITERTLEITAAINSHAAGLSASQQRSRRSSAFGGGGGPPAPVIEDDEPSTDDDEAEDDDEDDAVGDRAFVAGYPSGQQARVDQSNGQEGSSSSSSDDDDDDNDNDGSNSDSSSDSDSDDGAVELGSHPPPPPPPQLLDGMLSPRCVSRTPHVADSAAQKTASLAPVDPYDRDMLEAYLANLASPIRRHANVVDLTQHAADKLGGLQKQAKKRANSSKARDRTGTLDDAWDLELDGEVFSVREKLGEGSFGAVFRIAFAADDDDEHDDSFDVDGSELFLAVKVERPANSWEFHVLDQMQARLAAGALASILTPHRLYAYADESFLLVDLCDRGSLLDAVNRAHEYRIAPPGSTGTTGGLDELLALFFVVELLRTLEAFHAAGFVHGDLKIDNCLLRFDDAAGDDDEPWHATYDPSGGHGWGLKGLKVIDYGRTIDTHMFPPGQAFACDLKTDAHDCAEMQAGRLWTFEPDYHGVASIAYCALFGTYIETVSVPVDDDTTDDGAPTTRTKRVPKQPFRRYHQVDLWTKLFDMLLNPRDVVAHTNENETRVGGTALPITHELGQVRHEMEQWLVANCNKNGKSLKSLLSKLSVCGPPIHCHTPPRVQALLTD
ncbi:hypothetical protein JCM11491_000915 [Sporobolomyces phaffii]